MKVGWDGTHLEWEDLSPLSKVIVGIIVTLVLLWIIPIIILALLTCLVVGSIEFVFGKTSVNLFGRKETKET